MSSLSTDPHKNLRRKFGPEQGLDIGFVWLCRICAAAILGVLAWLVVQVLIEAFPSVQHFGLGFLTSSVWNPVTDQYGALPLIYGTLVTTLIAMLIALPIGLGVAIFLSEDFLPRSVQMVLVYCVEILAEIPSVVYGLWGIFVLIPILQVIGVWLHTHLGWIPIFSTYPVGPGFFPAGVILGVMAIPIVTSLSRQVLISLPENLRRASYAVGATRWQTIFQVLLPAGASGLMGATVLAIGRALGETMAVTMVIGNSGNGLSPSIFSPGYTIAALIANQFAEATSQLEVESLLYAGLLLLIISLIVNVLAELLLWRVRKSSH
jgi:phosphate transport system permease protein